MELELVLVDAAGSRSAVTVTAAPGDPVSSVRTALAGLAGLAPTAGPLHLDGRVVADRTPVREAGFVAGAVVALGRPLRDRSAIAAEGLELAVVGGLAAGSIAGLRLGRTLSVGRDPRCDLTLDDEEVSRTHATVTAPDPEMSDVDGVRLVDAGSRNGVRLRGYRMVGDGLLVPGDAVGVGETVLELRRPAPAAPIVAGAVVNRPPRIAVPATVPEVAVPTEPERPRAFRLPLAGVLAPLVLAAILFVAMDGNRMFLVFLGLSPLMMLANVLGDRRSGRKDYVAKKNEYDAAVAALDSRLAALAVAEERAERAALPDPAALLRAALAPTARLWERRPADEDFLRLRLGLVDRPLRVHLRGRAGEHPVPTVHLVPLAVDLADAGVLGVAGPRAALMPAARALLAQLGTLHDPDSVGLVLLTGRDEAADWEWASWLPHTRPADADQVCTRLVGTDYEQAEARIAELRRLLAERHQERRSTLRDGIPAGRRYVLVLDGARRLRELRGLADLLRDGPAVGVYAVCLDADEASLPDECRATAVAGPRSTTRWRVRLPGAEPVADVLADGLAATAADRLGRALAPLRLLGATGAGGGLPDSVRYLDLLGLPGGTAPTPADVLARWAAAPGARSTTALLGAGRDGPVTVDLRRDGPHALVAGTSGAGKSELLQTLVSSLALGNAPDALNVVLVDYKGGSAFAACQDLPHCVGMVTDLDGHLVRRALASLSAELRRREAILAEAGAKDIEDYWARTGGRLPRLVIVVDEFAALVEEIPEFVPGVVGIGMRGRSLGVHVVLATQRPAGVVSAEMRANLNLRIGLRVTSTAESSDVVDAPDAARISTRHPGRAYLRTGHQELTAFQAARVGWPRAELVVDQPVRAVPRRVAELGRPPARPAGPADDGAETDLAVLVGAIRQAAAETGAATPPSPWLPPLRETVGTAELSPVRTGSPVAVRLGVVDRPDRQAQETFVLDLERTGPLAVAGAVRSGRSTALRTLGAGLAAAAGPADVHLYALDCGNRALAGLAALPHCGAVVDGADTARVDRLLALLDAEVGRRQRLLGAGGYASLAEHRAAVGPQGRLPHVVLLVDRWEAFWSRYADVDAGLLVDRVEGLLRRGPAVGVTVVLSTDRTGFTHRVSSALAARLVLRQADREDAAVFGINPRTMPAAMPPGRAVWAATGEEMQVALLDPTGDEATGTAEAAAVERLAAALHRRWDGVPAEQLPRRVDPLPDRVTPAEAEALRVDDRPTAAGTCTVGVGGDHLAPLDVDLLDSGGTFVVAGPPRSGRSTALLAVAASLAGRKSGELPVVVLAPRPSPLRALAGEPGIRQVLTGTDVAAELDEVLAEIGGPVCLVVDDGELLGDGPAGTRLERFVRQARDDGSVLVAAATTEDLLLARYRGWLAAARRSRSGLLLDPRSHVDGEVFDLRLPRSTAGGWPAGRGLLVLRGAAVPVQVPAAEDSSVPS
ncbi:MAG TPA: FtsK/SpoIIIE domain-containing protein [Mycobacteriales bacterium]|nr:FtsK/SpoIIIE domain-containing protein [Mycobacteriales bacterium]